MTVYHIRLPLEAAKLELVKGLVAVYGLEAHQVLEIISDDPKLTSILSDLAEPPVTVPVVTTETSIPAPEKQSEGQQKNKSPRPCLECGTLTDNRSGYCSGKGYQRAWRARQKKQISTAAPEPVTTTADPAPAVLFGHNANHLPVRHGAIKGRKLG